MKSAEVIRLRAAQLGYWTADEAGQLAIRRKLNEGAGYSRQAIADALKRRTTVGRPRKPRCPHCGQPMPKEATP